MKILQLAITEFALPSPRTGSIEAYSGYGPLPNVGAEIHALIQEQRRIESPEYQAEKWMSHTFTQDGYRFTVNGRMDGFCLGVPSRVEEIKTAYSPDDLLKALRKNPDHPYSLQVRTYGYIHFMHTGQIPETVLHIVNARTRQGFDYPVELDVDSYKQWLTRRCTELIAEAQMFAALRKRRKNLAKNFAFPFAEPRQGQIELMQTVEKNLDGKTSQLLQAPTGLGKTAGVLFPVLKEALGRGQKVIYLTPKNTQHAVAEDALVRLQKAGVKARATTIHAKTKMCLKEQTLCNPEYCEYARDYYDKVAANQLVEKLALKKNRTARTFRRFGLQYEVCPFELQMETLPRADVVICDYNYVFSPRSILGRLANNGFEKNNVANLVIDEAHNLPARAADYFSATLASGELRALRDGFEHLPLALKLEAQQLVQNSLDLISSYATQTAGRAAQVELDFKTFAEAGAKTNEFLSRYLESPAELQIGDAVLRFCNLWSGFVTALEKLDDEFFCTYAPNPQGGALRIVCCDASAWLREGYAQFANVVAFSATLKPFDYYAKLLGFDQRPMVTAEFSSPFPQSKRKLLIVPQVSTKFSDREANYAKIQTGIEKILALKPGNYFVFFPSFDFLNRVGRELRIPGFEILAQARDMPRAQVQSYLDALRRPGQPTLILAVQGGVFAEGVDYPGEMLIGAIVVGPALPTFDFERELLRAYYGKKHGPERSFDYAYTFPAMAKVVQSAGRVIRSSTDRGLIVLMDRRFIQRSYVQSMPADWVGDNPNAHVSQHLLDDIREFWKQNET